MSASALQVFVLLEGQLLTSEVFGDGVYTLGSDEKCDLVLQHDAIAPLHAALRLSEGRATLIDQGSGIGTVVNGQPIREQRVTSADDIYLGPFLLKIRSLAKKKAVAVAPPSGIASPATGTPGISLRPAPPPPGGAPVRAPSALMPTPRPGGLGSTAPRSLASVRGAGSLAAMPMPSAELSDDEVDVEALVGALDPAGQARPSVPPRLATVHSAVEPTLRDGAALRRVIPPEVTPEITVEPVDDSAVTGEQEIPAQSAVSTTPVDPRRSPFSPPRPAPAVALRDPVSVPPIARGPVSVPPTVTRDAASIPPAARPPVLAPPASARPPASIPPADSRVAASAPLTAARPPASIPPASTRAPASPPTETPRGPVSIPAPPPKGAPPAPATSPATATEAVPARLIAGATLPPQLPVPGLPAAPLRAPQPVSLPPAPGPAPRAAPRPEQTFKLPPSAATEAAVAASTVARGPEGLYVRTFWGRQPISTRFFLQGQTVVAAPDDRAALPLFGFGLTGPSTIARAVAYGWSVHVPRRATVMLRGPTGRWEESKEGANGPLAIPPGGAVRLSVGELRVELSRERATSPARRSVPVPDAVFSTILLVLLIAGAVLLKVMPNEPKTAATPDVQRFAKYMTAMQERAKPKPPKNAPAVEKPVEKPPPKPIAQAETLKAATAQLRAVDQVASATRQIDSVLASLTKLSVAKGPDKHAAPGVALPSIPNLANLSIPSTIGDLGGNNGPLTKGLSALSGAGLMGSGTAGRGQVRGVPVTIPKKPTQVQGQIDRDALARVMNEHVDEMRGCYERALLRDPNIGAGKVTLEWTIGASGTVTEIATKTSSLRSSEVISCLLGVVRGLQFPKPQGGVVIVSYPILFNSVGY